MNLKRIAALAVKERKQMMRDSSNIAIGVLLPITLLLIFGFGMSMDLRNVDLAIVVPESSEPASEVVARFRGSEYFTVRVFASTEEGANAVRDHEADACLFLPPDFPRRLRAGNAELLIALNASNASVARMYENCIRGTLAGMFGKNENAIFRGVEVESRMWYNETNESRLFLIPGVIALVMALIGCMLTALQTAREYEQGTMEGLFATPATSGEIILAKMIDNYILGMIGLAISLLCARFLFHVPMRGSVFILLLGSSLFLLAQMALGLLISSATKSQFLSCQIAVIVSFLPVVLLSGFLFEISNMPKFLQIFSLLIPARWYVDFLQTSLLVGDVPENLAANLSALAAFALVFSFLAKRKNPKRMGGRA